MIFFAAVFITEVTDHIPMRKFSFSEGESKELNPMKVMRLLNTLEINQSLG